MRVRPRLIIRPYDAGFQAGRTGLPHNPRNSPDWKQGYAWGLQWARGDMETGPDDAWMIDPEMEAKG